MKIFLSSAESTQNLYKVINEVQKDMNLLVSFFYLRKKGSAQVKKVLDLVLKKSGGSKIMLDSGAFTFLNEYKTARGLGGSWFQNKKLHKIDCTPQEYFEDYLRFLKKYAHYFDYIVELDVDFITGYRWVKERRKELIDLVGVEKVVPVFHPTIPNCYEEWELWCKKYSSSVLGIGGIAEGGINVDKLFLIALKNNVKVHGFAMTKQAFMFKYPWFSVDSSSWNTGQRFGQLFYFDVRNSKLSICRTSQLKENLEAFNYFSKTIFSKIVQYFKFSFREILSHNTYSYCFDICNIYAFLQYEKHITSLWEAKGIKYD